jgi:tRNA pseudouridine55 synthase
MEFFGFLNIDKPAGITSHDVVVQTRRLLKIKKVGHSGTLDPLATGVLILCLGRGTRLVQFLDESEKVYQTSIRLGIETDTGDLEGKVIQQTDPSAITQAEIETALGKFIGEIEQIPPMYSAIKKNGKKLYELARAGETIQRQPRKVHIDQIHIIAFKKPLLTLSITCSRGTYIRSLAHDLGRRLGCGACLKELRRTRSGPFDINAAWTPEEIKDLQQRNQLPVIGPEIALSHLEALMVNEEASRKVCFGIAIKEEEICEGLPELTDEKQPVRICNQEGRLLAIGEVVKKTTHHPQLSLTREFHPRVVLC